MRLPTLFLLKNKKKPDLIGLFRVVRATGLEPAHRLTLEPKSSASANSATPADYAFLNASVIIHKLIDFVNRIDKIILYFNTVKDVFVYFAVNYIP